MAGKTALQAIALGMVGCILLTPFFQAANAFDGSYPSSSNNESQQALAFLNRVSTCAAAAAQSAEAQSGEALAVLGACMADMAAQSCGERSYVEPLADFALSGAVLEDAVSETCRLALRNAGAYAVVLGIILVSPIDTGGSGYVELILVGQAALVIFSAVRFCLEESSSTTTTAADTTTTTTASTFTTSTRSTSTTTTVVNQCVCAGSCECESETIQLAGDYEFLIERENRFCDVETVCELLCEEIDEVFLDALGTCREF